MTHNHLDEITLELYILKSKEVQGRIPEIESHLETCRGCCELHTGMASFYTNVKKDLEQETFLPVPVTETLPAVNLRYLEQKYKDKPIRRQIELMFPLRVARWMFKHPYVAFGGGVATFGLAAAMFIFGLLPKETKPKDLNPTHAEFAGEMMMIKNKFGATIQTLGVGVTTAGAEDRSYSLYDINGDGVNEVFWGQAASDNKYDVGTIYCYSLQSETTLWQTPLVKQLIFTDNQGSIDANYDVRNIKVGDFNADGKPEVLVTSFNRSSSQSLLLKLDAVTGKELEVYIHPGQFVETATADLDNDGCQEVLLCGTNDEIESACLIVLDPRFINGQASTITLNRVENYPQAIEKAYILIPRSIVGDVFKKSERGNQAKGIVVYRSNNSFKVTVNDVRNNKGYEAEFSLFIEFDLNVQNYDKGDSYEVAERKLLQEQRITRKFDDTYFEEVYKKKIQYWDGEKFVHQPTINKRYLEALNRIKRPS